MPGSALELADAVVGLIAGRCLTKRLTRAAGSAGIAGTARGGEAFIDRTPWRPSDTTSWCSGV